MSPADLKALADQCICHPASRSISDIEAAGEAINELMKALLEIAEMPLGRNTQATAGRMRSIALRATSKG